MFFTTFKFGVKFVFKITAQIFALIFSNPLNKNPNSPIIVANQLEGAEMISGVSNASLLVATSVNALKQAIDSNEEALMSIIDAADSESSGDSEGLDIYA